MKHALLSGLMVLWIGSLQAEEMDPAKRDFFEEKIRPILVNRCFECHANGQKKGNLSLETPDGLIQGGDSGPAIVAGKPEESLLIEAVRREGLEMPPKEPLNEQEVAVLTKWVQEGAYWPASVVKIPIGNLFDDDLVTPLHESLLSDQFGAVPNERSLAIDRVMQGLGKETEIAPGLQFDFSNLGGSGRSHTQVMNDAWGERVPIQTLGQPLSGGERIEQGVGIHANAGVTIDLFEIRRAGGIPETVGFRFLSERAGLNDTVFGMENPRVHLVVIAGKAVGADVKVLRVWVNGTAVEFEQTERLARVNSQIPDPIRADGKWASFNCEIPAEATFLTLCSTEADPIPADNPVSSDHAVYSGARLEFQTHSQTLAKIGKKSEAAPFLITAEHRNFWSFRPVVLPTIPEVQDPSFAKNEIDRFLQTEWEKQGLSPAPPAARLAWIRRVSFDLTGLPPSFEEVQAYLNDTQEGAEERVVDRLLASPHYGEHWGRRWLDIARYGEDQAHTFAARMYPNGYRYRDWVVTSLNADKPYNEFISEQIAGDLMPGGELSSRRTGPGLFALGPVYYADAGCAPKARLDELDDRVDTLGRGLLGLTIACARCHDHKFDPIPQTDYYALAGIFSSTEYSDAPLVPEETVTAYNLGQQQIQKAERALSESLEAIAEGRLKELPQLMTSIWKFQALKKSNGDLNPGDYARGEGLDPRSFESAAKLFDWKAERKFPALESWFELRKKHEQTPVGEWTSELVLGEVQKVAEGIQKDLERVVEIKASLRTGNQQQKLNDQEAQFYSRVFAKEGVFETTPETIDSQGSEDQKKLVGPLKDALRVAKDQAPAMYQVAHSLREGNVADLPVYQRGNPARPGEIVPRGFLSIISQERFKSGSGRKELADAIVDPRNPLTARVMVNRVWGWHFGRGIVPTPSNFGTLGERPSHPQLLDYLASTFMAEGWSLKRLQKRIVLSAAYRMSCNRDPKNESLDPDNRWFWRMNRRRVDVESWRDSLLTASGRLERQLGGPPGDLAHPEFKRRTLYGFVSRHNLNPLLRLFDFPDPNITSEKRVVTTVPLQQLFVLNSEFIWQQSEGLAERVKSSSNDKTERIRQAFRLALARDPSERELAASQEFLDLSLAENEQQAWVEFCQSILATNEMLYLD